MKVEKGYESLAEVLVEALEQAQHLKGFACHANNLPFLEQEIIKEGRTLGLMGHVFQIRKKVREAANCPDPARAIEDILGAMVYSAAMILLIREKAEKTAAAPITEFYQDRKNGLVTGTIPTGRPLI